MNSSAMTMQLAFSARQKLSLAVPGSAENLAAYLKQEERVVRVLMGSKALQVLGPAHYRYTLPRFKVFQLQAQLTIDLHTTLLPQRLVIRSCDCCLDSTAAVGNDFQFRLDSWLEARGEQVEGDASLAIQVSRPSLLRWIPKAVLESTGVRMLAGVLGEIKARIHGKFVQDFHAWCHENRPQSPPSSLLSPESSPES